MDPDLDPYLDPDLDPDLDPYLDPYLDPELEKFRAGSGSGINHFGSTTLLSITKRGERRMRMIGSVSNPDP